MRKTAILLIWAISLVGCTPEDQRTSAEAKSMAQLPTHNVPDKKITEPVFDRVVARVIPVAEKYCTDAQQVTKSIKNCDFIVNIDQRPDEPPNAFQSFTKTGIPVLTFTVALLDDLENEDEVAFILGHEAAHHILRHIYKMQNSAIMGAVMATAVGAVIGLPTSALPHAQDIGALVGARGYSKDHELEADELGALIAMDSGYLPLVGVEYFARMRDPGDVFLGTHPPNPERIQMVIDTVNKHRNSMQSDS